MGNLDTPESDKKHAYEYYRVTQQDSTYFGTYRGSAKAGKKRTLHGSLAPLDERYFDPNVLR